MVAAAAGELPESFFCCLEGYWHRPGGGNCPKLAGKACFCPPWDRTVM